MRANLILPSYDIDIGSVEREKSVKYRAEKGKKGEFTRDVVETLLHTGERRVGGRMYHPRYAETATLANLSVRIPRAIFPSFHG